MIDTLQQLFDIALHVNVHLKTFVLEHGPIVYGLIWLIVFCETGLVIFPFLPGDSLLFACGALAADGLMSIPILCLILISAAFVGDNCNYWLGRSLGPKILRGEKSRFFSRKNLEKSQKFFEKHGPKAVILARFVPIVRTFAPFTAGVGQMSYTRFISYSLLGSLLWVTICVGAGYLFGAHPLVKKNFELVVIGVIAVSLLPIAIEFIRAKFFHKGIVEEIKHPEHTP